MDYFDPRVIGTSAEWVGDSSEEHEADSTNWVCGGKEYDAGSERTVWTEVSTRLLIPLLWITVRKIPAWKFPAWKIPVMKGDLENYAMSSEEFVFDVIVL